MFEPVAPQYFTGKVRGPHLKYNNFYKLSFINPLKGLGNSRGAQKDYFPPDIGRKTAEMQQKRRDEPLFSPSMYLDCIARLWRCSFKG